MPGITRKRSARRAAWRLTKVWLTAAYCVAAGQTHAATGGDEELAAPCEVAASQLPTMISDLQGAYYGVDVHMRVILDRLQRRTAPARSDYPNLQERTTDVIRYLGELLPRLERAMDLPALAHHLRNNSLVPSAGALPGELIGIAFVDVVAGSKPDAQNDLAAFLDAIAQLDHRLVALINKADGVVPDDLTATASDLQRIYKENWIPLVKTALFADDAEDRMQAALDQHCAAAASPFGDGVLRNRPLTALCGTDPDLMPYYQRERRAVLLHFNVTTGALLQSLSALYLKDEFDTADSARANRLRARAAEVRRTLAGFFPTIAAADNAALQVALQGISEPPPADATLYELLDRFLANGILLSAPRNGDNLQKFSARLAKVESQLGILANDHREVEPARFAAAFTGLRNVYVNDLEPALQHMLVTSSGLRKLESSAARWCATRQPTANEIWGQLPNYR